MKTKSLIAAALLAAGVISAQAASYTVYLTGSTAFRGIIYSTLTSPGTVLNSPSVLPSGTGSGAGSVVFEGTLVGSGDSYTIVASWTGSEAGIASTVGTTISQSLPLDPNGAGPYNLPGAPVTGFLAPPYTSATTFSSGIAPDLTMADTSQAVSLTKSPALTPFGIVGIVTFEWLKGKNSAPDSSWTDLNNVTHPQILFALAGTQPASFFTGKAADSDVVAVVGRNKGSGTRVNCLLDDAYGVNTAVDQYAANSSYPGATPGALTFGAIGMAVFTEVGNDGFDSGSGVANSLQCDLNGTGGLLIGYAGLSDASTAIAGGAKALTLNGVAESNGAIEYGEYSYWGHENMYGSVTLNPGVNAFANALKTGIATYMTANGYGSVAANQDIAIPTAAMHATKTGDTGYPFPD